MDLGKSVQGVALYGEFARTGATTQIIVSPDGYDTEGNEVPMCIIRRTVTTSSPRKQWRFSSLVEGDTIPTLMHDKGLTLEQAKERYCDERMRYASGLFEQIVRGDWTLVGDPILVEVSKIDLDAIRDNKTPTKLIYRINQSRTAQGYPADLVNETTPTPAAV